MISAETRGVFAIAPTPFLPSGALDIASLGRMTERYRAYGVDGLTILGIMGESNKLTPEESRTFAKRGRLGGTKAQCRSSLGQAPGLKLQTIRSAPAR